MQGKIVAYNSDSKRGLIRGEDDNEYRFVIDESDSLNSPSVDADVHFEPIGDKAIDLYVGTNNEVEDIKATVFPTGHAAAKKSNKSMSVIMMAGLALGVGALLVVLIISEVEQRKLEELQNSYHSQIISIEQHIRKGNCLKAASNYHLAGDTRNEIYKQGSYYSLEPHAIQAHAIDIAECFAQRRQFKDAIGMLDIEKVNNVDYLRRAAKIYKNAGDSAKAREAELKAEKYNSAY